MPARTPVKDTPKVSPYKGGILKFGFRDGVLQVPRGLIEQYPTLMTIGGDSVGLSHLSEREGHIIIHFFHTGTYQCLESTKKENDAKNKEAIATSLKVYDFATAYKIDVLASLALDDIMTVGKNLNFSQLVRTMDTVRFTLDYQQGGLADYLNERAAMAEETITEAEATKLRDDIGEDRTLANILLENMVRMKLVIQKYQTLLGPLA